MSTSKNHLVKLDEELQHVVSDVQKYRRGQVLTIIDACIPDPVQRKAIKDLIHNALNEEHCYWSSAQHWMWEFSKTYAPKLLDDLDFDTFVGRRWMQGQIPPPEAWNPFDNVTSTNPKIEAVL